MFIESASPMPSDTELLPLELGYLPERFAHKATNELNETSENIRISLRLMKELVKKDKATANMNFEDQFLLLFLRAKKYNVHKAINHLKTLLTFKRKHPLIFEDIKYEVLVEAIDQKIVNFLPYRCSDGCAILLVQLDNWNPISFPIESIKRMIAVYFFYALREHVTQINGFKVIFDVKSNPIRHLRYATPSNLYMLYHGTQECIPGRFKAVHIVNNSLTFKAAFLIIKQFFSEKLKRRIVFHPNNESLLDYFSPYILPAQYGGYLVDYNRKEWLRTATLPENLIDFAGPPIS